jgi:nucleoside-diphosphate-sugar epimerase
MSVFAITGTNGFVGSVLSKNLQEHGHQVIALQRRDGFVLGQKIPSELLRDVDVLVHVAWDLKLTAWEDMERTNVRGSVDLFQQAIALGVKKIVFVSSMSAFEGCRSWYGRAKLAVENFCAQNNIVIIRPGLVWNENAGGMVGKLENLIKLSPVLPYIAGAKSPLNLVHVDDLTALIEGVASGEYRGNLPIIAAHEKGLFIRDILKVLAFRKARKLVLFPMPWPWVWVGLKILEVLKLKIGLGTDNLMGLVYQNPNPDFVTLQNLKSKFRAFT